MRFRQTLLSLIGKFLPFALTEYGIVAYQDTIYVAGGVDPNVGRRTDVLEYNPETEEWRVNSQLSQPRGKMAAMMVDSVIFPPCEDGGNQPAPSGAAAVGHLGLGVVMVCLCSAVCLFGGIC